MSAYIRCDKCGEDSYDVDTHTCECGNGQIMSMKQIKEAADWAETYPGSRVLNFGEVGFQALADWVIMIQDEGLSCCDVESVKQEFEKWWKRENGEKA